MRRGFRNTMDSGHAMRIDALDFAYIQKLVRERSAIVLGEGKEYLVEAQLLPLARREGFTSLQGLVAQMRAEPFNGLHRKVLEALANHETLFFRDVHPFEALKNSVLPELLASRLDERKLNLWSAACSSGQEPYSIAMLLREYFPLPEGWSLQLIASDFSSAMLARARAGRYTQLEINRGLPAALLVKYFQKQGLEWRIKQDIRRMVEFHQINLAEPWPLLPPMDVIFLRNVLIYFDEEPKKTILGKVAQLLRCDGYLFLGATESPLHLDDSFEPVQFERSCCYRLRRH